MGEESQKEPGQQARTGVLWGRRWHSAPGAPPRYMISTAERHSERVETNAMRARE